MKYPLKELETRFNKVLEKDAKFTEPYALPKAAQALKVYLSYIKETPPFNTIAREARDAFPTALLNRIEDGSVDIEMARPIVRALHQRLVEGTEELIRAGRKDMVFFPKEGYICALGEEANPYQIKADSPKRFKIVKILWGTETGKSALEIAKLLDLPNTGKSAQDVIKDDIQMTNEKFMEKIGADVKLILSSKPSRRNIYRLNRESFSWISGTDKVR